MKCRTAAPVPMRKQDIDRELTKGYIRLLTQQTVHTVKKIDAFFFGPNGEDAKLRHWYYVATALCLAIGMFIFVSIN
ncbi:hypothetical protein [Solibacillus sp. FSL H8-0538]|uniref:hypothetical protein n=1 Tax=Solibacillus sp. FSL H8-0538 TaxID=2921400 RepID=UPI0030F57680